MSGNRYPEAIWFDISFVVAITVSVVLSLIHFGVIKILTPALFMLLGSAFLYCKRYKEVSYVERGLFWFSDNVPTMRLESNHILIGLFMIAVGFASAILPSNRGPDDEVLWHKLRGSPLFWLSVMMVLFLNIGIGLYNHQKRKTPGANSSMKE